MPDASRYSAWWFEMLFALTICYISLDAKPIGLDCGMGHATAN